MQSDHLKVLPFSYPACSKKKKSNMVKQDSVRSAVYSSLVKPLSVGCDNGNGAVQFGSARRSKTLPSVEVVPIVHEGRCCRGLHQDLILGEEEAMDYRESAELQLSDVSRGAHKLTKMIESLSKAPNLDGRSKHIAEGLLTGALDLQESLSMLRKLQDASKLMSDSRRRPKSDTMAERSAEDFGVEVLRSSRFERSSDGFRRDKFHEPRLSVDGSSRRCAEEVKKMIKDSLHQQNLLCSSDDEKASSSQSVNFSASCSFEEQDSERKKPLFADSAIGQAKREKPRSLIAKLMGLEEIPSGTAQPLQKDMEKKKKSFSPVKHGFDTEKSKAAKTPSVERSLDQKQKSLQEIIDNMQFKGLLKNAQVEEQRIKSRYTDISLPEKHDRDVLKVDEPPPIVIIKPMHFPCWEKGEVQKDSHLGKVSVQEERHSVKLVREKKASDDEWRKFKTSERKEVKSAEKTNVESFPKAYTFIKRIHRQHKEDDTARCRKVEGRKPLLNGNKQEVKDMKPVPISQTKTSNVGRAQPNERSAGKKDVLKPASIPQNHTLNCSVIPLAQHYISSTEEKATTGAKPVRKSTSSEEVVSLSSYLNASKNLGDSKADNFLSEMDGISKMSTIHTGDPPKQAEKGSKPCTEDVAITDKKMFSEVISKTAKTEPKYDFVEAAYFPDHKKIIRESTGIEGDIKRLLLSSQSFLSLAQKLFTLDVRQPIYYRRKGQEDIVTRNAKLFLECGKELLAQRRHEIELVSHPLSNGRLSDRTVFSSLDQLAEEVSYRIGGIVRYFAVDVNATPKDSLFNMLQRDLRCKDMTISATWDICWINWISIEDSDQIIIEVEEHILSSLIEEITIDCILGCLNYLNVCI